MNILKRRKKDPIIKLYRSIESLPIWNWDQVKKTDDLRYLIKPKEYEELPEVEVAETVWQTMLDEYSDNFKDIGTGGHFYDKYMDLQKALRDEVIFSCDEFNSKLSKTKVKVKQLEKDLELAPTEKQGLEWQAIQMEIFFSKDFDTKTISTYRWYKYLQEYERRIEELQNPKTPKT